MPAADAAAGPALLYSRPRPADSSHRSHSQTGPSILPPGSATPKPPDNHPASPSGKILRSKNLLPQPGPLKVGPADLKSLVAGGRPAECGIDGSGMGGSRRAVPRTHQPRNQPAPQLQDFKEGNLQAALYLTHCTTSSRIKTLSDFLPSSSTSILPSIFHHCLSTRY